jgi:hypothetical protein
VGGERRVLLVLRHARAVQEPGLRDLPFPTSALAVVQLPGRWADAGPGGELVRIWTPRSP